MHDADINKAEEKLNKKTLDEILRFGTQELFAEEQPDAEKQV